jgi:pyruvate dehydrogenase (quinone)
LSKRLPDYAILTADSGSVANWYARDLKLRPGMMASLSGNLATMGPAMPYAIAAKMCYPERHVFALAGDGAMQMNGLNELITVSKYWKSWSNPHFVVVVLNNRDLNLVTWEQRVLTGDPRFDASQELPNFPYARFAESIGLAGIKVNAADQIAPAWEEALQSDRPVLFEAYVDPNVPPTPPHITMEQTKHLLSSIVRGDAEALGFMKQIVRDVAANYAPKGKK